MRAATRSASEAGPVLVERLEVGVEGPHVVREALREVGQRVHLVAAPAELAVDARELLEHLRLRGHLVGELAKRLDRLGQSVLLGVVERRQQTRAATVRGRARAPAPRSARARGSRASCG